MEWKKTLMVTGGVAALIGAALTVPIVSSNSRSSKARETRSSSIVSRDVSSLKGTDLGIVYVSNVQELQNAIRTASDFETIVVTKKGSPYNLAELPCMHTNGYLYVTNSITIRGETGNPADVVISADTDISKRGTNRIFYVKSPSCKFSGLTIKKGNCCSTNNILNPYGPNFGGGIHRGGAFYLALPTNDCIIANCHFNENKADSGGAIACAKRDDTSSVVKSCSFLSNAAVNGGAIFYGGMIESSSFDANVSQKNGGAVCYGTLVGCESGYNIANSNGMELYGCTATGHRHYGISGWNGEYGEKAGKFTDVLMDRSRFEVINGILFSGWYEVRSSTITDGTNFALSVASPGKWDYDNLDYEGRPTWKPSRLVNCTIADNRAYSFLSSGSIGEGLEIYNTIFDKNTTWINGGKKVNLNLATNGYYKTVYMTYAQRYIALGWDGELTNTKVQLGDMGGYQIVIDTMNLTSEYDGRIVISEKSGESEYVSVSYEQYYFAHGWNGDTSISEFTAKPVYTEVAVDSPTRFDKIMEPWTNSQTWYDYYMEFEFDGVRWDGVSDYTYHALVECAFSRSVSNVFTRTTQTAPAGICSSFFTIPNIEYVPGWDWEEDWIWRCCTEPIDFDFFGELEPRNPYAIKLSSPAYHRNKYYYGIEETIYLDWMQTALDLRGVPRLSSDESWSWDTLDIGAYQATEYRKPTKFIIRIR